MNAVVDQSELRMQERNTECKTDLFDLTTCSTGQMNRDMLLGEKQNIGLTSPHLLDQQRFLFFHFRL